MGRWPTSVEERFFRRVTYYEGHAFWDNLNGGPYGKFYINGRNVNAQRAYLIITTGQDPKGMEAAHNCEFKHCVRHVRWATKSDNQLDRQLTITHCPKGHVYTEENSYYHYNIKTKKSNRQCRACHSTRQTKKDSQER